MPALLLHLTAVERLAADARKLPPPIARALNEDIEYARLGTALPDLPQFGGLLGGWRQWPRRPRPVPHFARLLHGYAPVALGLKMAELVAMGALVGKEPGLAFVSGYFAHLCLDRTLHPLVETLAARHRQADETGEAAHARIDWLHALFYLRDLHGRDMAGNPYLRSRFQVTKRAGPPARGIGRGLYELIRLASQETLQQAPTKSEIDRWVRGMYLYGFVLSSPVGRLRGLPSYSNLSYRELYQGPDVDVPAAVEKAQALTREVLERLSALMNRTHFTARLRARFLDEFPEGSVEACAA
ncbi:MAG: hypothetical protein IRZ16_08735 [Myxococcaceae bacterium]|nr:hypothetical protein [Myxococcaceae bacterium]